MIFFRQTIARPLLKSISSKNCKVGLLTDLSLTRKVSKHAKKLNNKDGFIGDSFAKILNMKIFKNNDFEFLDKASDLIKEGKLKVKVFSRIPFFSKARIKLTYLNEQGKKETFTKKFKLKELIEKPTETMEEVFNKVLEITKQTIK